MQYFISLESNPSTDHIHNFKPVRFTRSLPFFFSKECGKKKTQQENQVLSHFNKLTYNCNKFIDFDRLTTWGTYIYNIEADEIYIVNDGMKNIQQSLSMFEHMTLSVVKFIQEVVVLVPAHQLLRAKMLNYIIFVTLY